MLDVSCLKLGTVSCPALFTYFQCLVTLVQYGSLGPLDMAHLGLVVGGRIDLLVLHQPQLFLVDGSFLPGGLCVVAPAWVKTAAVVREEGLPTDELAEHADKDCSDEHADGGNGDASNYAHKDGEDDVRGHLAEEQRPTIRTVEHSVVLVVVAGRLGVALVVASLAAHHASAAVHLHLVDLVGDDGLQPAQGGCAFGFVTLW